MFLLLFLLIILLLIYYYLEYQKDVRACAKRLPGFPMLPIIGNLHQIPGTSEEIYNFIMKMSEFGTVSRVLMGPFLQIHISDSSVLEEILLNKPLNEKGDDVEAIRDWIGEGLFMLTGIKWKIRRKMLNPAFNYNSLKSYVSIYERNIDVLIKRLDQHVDGKSLDIHPLMELYTLDVIGEVAVGLQLNTQIDQNKDYVRAIHYISTIFLQRSMSAFIRFDAIFKLTSRYKTYKQSLKIVRDVAMTALQKRRQFLNECENKEKRENEPDTCNEVVFLDYLLSENGDSTFTDDQLLDEVNTFLFAGNDPVASAISFLLHSLSQNGEIQNKVFDEQVDVFDGDIERRLTYNDFNKMKYAEMVIKESLRLHPPIPAFFRKVTGPLTVQGVPIPCGSSIVINLLLMNRNPDVFQNPIEFRPERFEIHELNTRHALSYIPFSVGPRNCIGQKLAIHQIKAVLSALIRKFVFLPDNSDLTLTTDIVLKSSNGIKVKLARR